MTSIPFENRAAAGRELASKMAVEPGWHDSVVLALPRGGVPVGSELARALDAELDLMMVRKIGTPGQSEFAMGAVSSGGVCLRNDAVIKEADVSEKEFRQAWRDAERELDRLECLYRKHRHFPTVRERRVILVDDGLATGTSMLAAIQTVSRLHPLEIVVAVPVGSQDAVEKVGRVADQVVCLATPEPFLAVGLHYRDFDQVSDQEVCATLHSASASPQNSILESA